MAKLNKDKIGKDTIVEYLNIYSDFSFEIKVLKEVKKLGFKVEHNGTYKDPITNKHREYDIRATKKIDNYICRLAIECKNIRDNFPLVAHCLKRKRNECFHQIIVNASDSLWKETAVHSRVIHRDYHSSIYKEDDFVAKFLDQVGLQQIGKEKTVVNSDTLLFDKVSQAINSCYDLLTETRKEEYAHITNTIILPLLVIPDDRLWKIEYDEENSSSTNIELVRHLSYYINIPWTPLDNSISEYRISHLELITFSYLETFLNNYFGDLEAFEEIFLE